LNQFTYQLAGKGDVIISDVVKVPNKKNFQFDFSPTLAMIPKANVIVYYITEDGEIISDNLKIEFANELKNFVDIQVSKQQVKPGEDLDISVSSNPNSFVGLLGVDQSVLLLKKGNDIEKSTVFDELERYNKVDKHNNEWNRNFDQSNFRDFDSSEAVIITNAKKQHGEKGDIFLARF
jgi:CD109 antigen